ncbi:MAG: endonuclease domain-containing protein [Rhodothermales bacterium]|nr:endonuclease domain-containing protein [Rhodothermales bacterium]
MSRPPRILRNRKALKQHRRQLRQQATPAEVLLWQGLRRRQLRGRKFRRQYSIGPFIVDFCCPEEHLVIELDGSVHDDPLRREYDEDRTVFLEKQGMRVLRFENRAVLEYPEGVLETIALHFTAPT